MRRKPIHFTFGAFALLAISGFSTWSLLAEEKAALQGGPGNSESVESNFFTQQVVEAFTKGKFNINVRLRYELADQKTFDPSHAFTVRPRFGFTTAPLYGFQSMIEAENITVLGPRENFNAAGSNGQPGKTSIPDPPTTEINQAWLSYSNWDTTVKGGRQRLVLDNERFVGDVGWRQNMQTLDAASLVNTSLKDFTFSYAYVWEVHRVFGNVDHLPAANRDFDSDSHLINLSYNGCKFGKFTVYSYLLDFPNLPNNSSATFGGSFNGAYTFDKDSNAKLTYRAEYARQMDYRSQPLNYSANYYDAELGGAYRRFSLGGGYEVLGSDGGKKGFSTPLATLHAFNGWADVFVNTPNAGLRDLSAFAAVNLPGNIPVRFVYHKYDADSSSADFGQEFDAIASRKFGKNWTVLLEYAFYDARHASPPAQAAPSDVQKFWAQVEFNF